MADVSIIIPTYNRLWSLPKAVDSCYDAALNIETIIIDDGSTDATGEWLAQKDGVITIRQENLGKDAAVNKGFSVATGKYVRFLDSDDWLLPGSTAALFAEAEKNKLDVVCAGYQLFNSDEKLLKEIPWTVCDDFLAQQLGECDSSHYSAYLFKKDFIIDIPHRAEYGALDDRQFVIEVAMKRPKVGYVNMPTLVHRAHQNERLQSMTAAKETATHFARLKIYKSCFDTLEKDNRLTERYKKAASNTLWHLAHWMAKTHLKEAAEVYNWVYELNPGFKPNENPEIARLYKRFGFKYAERLMKLRRLLK